MDTITATKGIRDFLSRLLRGITKPISNILRPGAKPKPTPPPAETLSERLAKVRQDFIRRSDVLAQQVARGEIIPRQFKALMLTEIRISNLTAAALAAGGIGNLLPEDLARIDAEVRRQGEYLERWINELERQPVETRSEARIRSRARLYANIAEKQAQETLDKNVYRGLPDLPFMPRDGTTQCKTQCKCRWEWRNVNIEKGDADVYWKLGQAEHCETCLRRASAFAPLRIRGGRFVNLPDLNRLEI